MKKIFNRKNLTRVITFSLMVMMLTLTVFASGEAGDSGTTSSAITDVGTALTGIIGYLSGVTSALLGNDLWILGMGFFVISFVAGFVMYLFRVGRR